MRRARIKALATVPVRRKTTQDTTSVEAINQIGNESKENNIDEGSTPVPMILKDDKENECHQEVLTINQVNNEEVTINNDAFAPDNNTEQHNSEIIEISPTTITASPSKGVQNRSCFMRPTPRLNNNTRIRKNSVQGSGASASESEDDNKRITNAIQNKVYNELTAPTQCNKEVSTTPVQNNVIKLKSGQKRRILVSESARKLAEARRDFFLKHENKTPDRSKLTMYDLIYYNPISNPMKPKESIVHSIENDLVMQNDEMEQEETEDDPSAMPAPQVKVGPDGQLILDEQSLVIEQTNVKKNRGMINKKAIVIDENNGTGFYKRRRKSKEWPQWETLKFYKALHRFGTDFLLMQYLFPKRTRKELKIKFKKEEKLNPKLVEKALANHQELSSEMESEFAEFEESFSQHSNVERDKEARIKKKGKPRKKQKCGLVRSSIAQISTSEDENTQSLENSENNRTETNNNQCQQRMKRRPKHGGRKTINEIDDDVESNSVVDSDSETEIYQVRPTRSGRLPKIKKLQGPDINSLHHSATDKAASNTKDKSFLRNAQIAGTTDIEKVNSNQDVDPDVITSAISNISKVEPGSLVILSEKSIEEPGKTFLQVYMVNSNSNSIDNTIKSELNPVNLTPELLATVTTKLSDASPVTIEKECD